jgi:hypothetical protein
VRDEWAAAGESSDRQSRNREYGSRQREENQAGRSLDGMRNRESSGDLCLAEEYSFDRARVEIDARQAQVLFEFFAFFLHVDLLEAPGWPASAYRDAMVARFVLLPELPVAASLI